MFLHKVSYIKYGVYCKYVKRSAFVWQLGQIRSFSSFSRLFDEFGQHFKGDLLFRDDDYGEGGEGHIKGEGGGS